jgi:glutathione peroxidase
LKLLTPLSAFVALSALLLSGAPAKFDVKVDIYAFNLPDIKGKMISFAQFKDKALLIVNVASNSNFTPQYAGLEALYQKHKADGLVVLGFPSNDFGAQEPESDVKIAAFCESTYHVTFPLFSKVAVRGDGIIPLFSYLTKEANPKLKGDVHWNFSKFVIDRKGKLSARFSSDIAPDDPDLLVAIENALNPKEEKPDKEEAKPDSKPTREGYRPPGGA